MDLLTAIFGRSGFLPHGYCFTWTPGLLWSMVGADAAIAAAYFSIPAAILSFVRQRRDLSIRGMALLFSAFIFACGITHVMDVWTIWQPDYGVQALTKTVTAMISIVTAVMLWRLLPQALKVPTVQGLQSTVATLEAEIARRREAEREVVDVQQSLAITLATIGAAFVATDRAGKVSRMNAVAEQLLGWTQAEARGLNLWHVFDREDRPAEHAAMNPVDVFIEEGITVDRVHRIVAISRTGKHTDVELQAALTRADDGSVLGLAMVFRDVTRLARAEADSKQLASIVESSNDAIIGETLEGTITSWNGGAHTLYGYSAEEAIGQTVQMILPPDRHGEESAMLASISLGAALPTFDTVHLAKDGSPREVSVTISPIRNDAGRVVGIAKIARNIAVQRRGAAALRENESLLNTIHTHFIVSITDRAGRITEVNDSFCAISGYRHEELIGQTHRIINSGVQAPAFWSDLWRTISTGRPWRGEICNRARNGSLYWVDSVIAPLTGDDGRVEKYISIRTDVTAAKRAEDARLETLRLEAENRQIREASRLKSQFLANMSHELRTPLNAVIGFADLLHSGFVSPDSPKHQLFLGHIGTSGRHLLQLINDVLDLSKVESGKFDFFPERVDMPALLKEVNDILHTAILRKSIDIVTDIDPDLPELNLDPSRLKQVLYNYLSNAIKFSHPNGTITVRVSAEGRDHVRLEVEDTGIGISPADLTRLFTEFQQLDTGYSKQHQGTGLGLALTRRLVEAQGGRVGIRSTIGRGSVFHVVLNRIHGLDAQRATAATDRAPVPEGRRVLVIEHDQRDQARLVAAFSEAGFQADAASDGAHALRRARDTNYAALTLDLQLPEQRGLELLESIRSHGASHAAPVIGIAMPGDLQTAATFAIANVLCKPIRSDEILAAIGRIRPSEGSSQNVIVIDDDPTSLDLMRATLKSLGINAVCFADGREALREIDRQRPDAIILDLMMPEFDGFQVLDALQGRPASRDVPVFIWTSLLLTDQEYADLARSARAILIKGGGAMEDMLESVLRWRLSEATTAQKTAP